jgi:hypothetical protein
VEVGRGDDINDGMLEGDVVYVTSFSSMGEKDDGRDGKLRRWAVLGDACCCNEPAGLWGTLSETGDTVAS